MVSFKVILDYNSLKGQDMIHIEKRDLIFLRKCTVLGVEFSMGEKKKKKTTPIHGKLRRNVGAADHVFNS